MNSAVFLCDVIHRGTIRAFPAPRSLACETAGRSLWGAMTEAKLPCCYTDTSVLASAVRFAFSAGDRDTGRDREIGGGDHTDLQQQQHQLQGEGQGHGRSQGQYQGQSEEGMSMDISRNASDQPLGIQVTCTPFSRTV